MRHFTSDDLHRLGRAGAVAAIRGYLAATGRGRTHAPPRLRVPVGSRTLVYTVGADEERDVAGFRLYSIGEGTPPAGAPDQLVVAARHSTGEILATGVGETFGVWRTAALGAVAMDEATQHIDRPIRAAILGAGLQARHHARTWAATRPIEAFRVWARRVEAAQEFAAALSKDTGVVATACATSDDAVQEADAVLGVTRSATPVVSDAAIGATAYVATVGPKFGGRHELPAALYAGAGTLFSDAPAQCAAFEADPGPMPGGRTASEMLDLSKIVASDVALPTAGRRLFVSEGLAGSEVALLSALLG